jgi:hypothetical protein
MSWPPHRPGLDARYQLVQDRAERKLGLDGRERRTLRADKQPRQRRSDDFQTQITAAGTPVSGLDDGILGLVGASALGDELSFDAASIMDGGRVVRGIVEGDADPHVFIPKLVALHAEGRFPLDRLIRYYPFEDINAALSDAEQRRTVKPVLRIGTI